MLCREFLDRAVCLFDGVRDLVVGFGIPLSYSRLFCYFLAYVCSGLCSFCLSF